jgi:hypothetical protein
MNTITHPSNSPASSGGKHPAPNPGIVAVVFTALFLASLVPVTLLFSKMHFPSPDQPAEEIIAYFLSGTETMKIRICAFLQFGSAIPLGIYTATMVSRLWFHGVRAAGVTIALFGGLMTSAAVALSALLQWAITQPGVATEGPVTLALYFLIYAVGGPGFSVPIGLLFAGIAIPAGFRRLLPKWLVIFGLILAIAGELSALSLVIPQALFLIPLTRFPGFIWLILAGFKLSGFRSRSTDNATAQS